MLLIPLIRNCIVHSLCASYSPDSQLHCIKHATFGSSLYIVCVLLIPLIRNCTVHSLCAPYSPDSQLHCIKHANEKDRCLTTGFTPTFNSIACYAARPHLFLEWSSYGPKSQIITVCAFITVAANRACASSCPRRVTVSQRLRLFSTCRFYLFP
eukprot:SAG11_NODE_4632_length_1826_cov_1.185292_1_plen_154_part_00